MTDYNNRGTRFNVIVSVYKRLGNGQKWHIPLTSIMSTIRINLFRVHPGLKYLHFPRMFHCSFTGPTRFAVTTLRERFPSLHIPLNFEQLHGRMKLEYGGPCFLRAR
jgi:hypothetical protein